MIAAERVLADSPCVSLNSMSAVVWSCPIVAPRSSPRSRASGAASRSSRATQNHRYQQPSIGHEFGCTWIDLARPIWNIGRKHDPYSRLVPDRNAANE